MASDAEMRQFLKENVEAQLTFIWDEHRVPLKTQYDVGQIYSTLRLFTTIADDRANVRAAVKDDFGLDPGAAAPAGAQNRATAGALVASWEVAKDLLQKEAQLRAEAKVHDVPRRVPANEKLAMRKVAELTAGSIPNKEFPHNDYLASKMEEVENDEVTASPLDEIISVEDSETQTLSSAVDQSGHIRITRTKNKTRPPANSEELRIRLRIEFHTWLLISSKHVNKTYLQGLDARTWERYADYLLGDRVHCMMVPVPGSDSMQSLNPPWHIVLHYEFQIRKAAFKKVRESQTAITIMEALQQCMVDPELKEMHFTSPIALQGRVRAAGNFVGEDRPWKTSRWEHSHKGKGSDHKGKGSKGGKGKGHGKGGKGGKGGYSRQGSLLTHTPDGRQICYNFNSENGCKEPCPQGRVHACRKKGCLGSHPLHQCKQK